ncbi:helix-turn-helix transcriptional regulator [Methylophilus sp. DW102]|uniref:helix-turn-helix transcriptional regulator n=1 Tax=Methylophilus sp. DW102 TaxID=3095607 RepID=UPI0030912750|nr:helix-turn-helix domain-containing protein [Methylophilus sp. DW102]
MSDKNKNAYIEFGRRLVELRNKAHLSQNEFAISLKASQQTVSRWERGESRPRFKQFDLIVRLLSADANELLVLAGYGTSKGAITTYDQPFPVDSLSPDSFERLCLHLVTKLYPNSKAHRAGGTGHKQDGIDVEVQHVDGTVYTFQCKRVDNFGAAKVTKAINDHIKKADKKFLFLSLIASPQARNAINGLPDWEIWDKEDISLKIRELSKLEQRELVDIFFRGQRLALLGETEAGPWMTLDELFKQFLNKELAFNHHWTLIGRDKEQTEIANALNDKNTVVIFIGGAGGSGKSKLLYQSLVSFQNKHPDVLVRLASVSESITNKSLEDLGSGEKLLVVDDAHEREDLPLLYHYVANPANKARLIISVRLYGLERAQNEAVRVNLPIQRMKQVTLDTLTLKDSTHLAAEALKQYGGPLALASDIAKLTKECPLATVIAAQVVAKEKLRPALIHNASEFRRLILSRFQQVIAGEITQGQDANTVTKILKILALIQPFSIEDERTYELIEAIELVRSDDSKRLTKLLINSGVIFKRGGLYRISPDLLADHIIEENCIDATGKSSGYAEKVFDKANYQFLEKILLNLSKLDWIRANGDPSNSHLLDAMWGKLNAENHLSAMTAVAYYQPDKALQFAERAISDGEPPTKLPDLVKYAAYNYAYIPRACDCLWELGKVDNRELHQTPEHAIRILCELCAVEPNKPMQYCESIVDYALDLLDKDDAWEGKYTPYDVLKGIMLTEGHTTTSNGREISMNAFMVHQPGVAKLRAKVIDAAINRLSSTNLRIATHSAAFLHNALRYPMGQFGKVVTSEEKASWTDEFVETLKKIQTKVRSQELDSVVLIELKKSINWHAYYSEGATRTIASSILTKLPKTLHFRTQLTLIDGYGHEVDAFGHENKRKKWEISRKQLVSELLSTYPKPKDLFIYIQEQLEHVDKFNVTGNISPQVLVFDLIEASDAFAGELLEAVLKDNGSVSNRFVSSALNAVFRNNRNRGLGMSYAKRLLQTHNPILENSVAHSLDVAIRFAGNTPAEINLIRQLLWSKSKSLVISCIHAIWSIALNGDIALAIELMLSVDISNDSKIADQLLSLCSEDRKHLSVEVLGEEVIYELLKKLVPLPELTGHWVGKFIAECSLQYPYKTAKFFMDRVDIAASSKDYSYRACNYGPWKNVALKFRESSEFTSLIHTMWTWMRSHNTDDYFFNKEASRLFVEMFIPFDEPVLIFLRERFRGDKQDIELISNLLDDVSSEFCFQQSQFVIDFLNKAKAFGKDTLESAISALYTSGVSGMRSGIPGQPFPQDIFARDESVRILQNLSRTSPAYKLYTWFKEGAERDIASAIKENESFEDD